MTRKRKRLRLALLAVAYLLYAATAMSAGKAPQAPREAPPLAMQELEVRGVREKPDRLFLPAPKRLFHSAPLRYDLFTDDLAKPILRGDVRDGTLKNGGAR